MTGQLSLGWLENNHKQLILCDKYSEVAFFYGIM